MGPLQVCFSILSKRGGCCGDFWAQGTALHFLAWGKMVDFIFRQQHLIQEIQLRWDSPKMTSSHIFLLQRFSVYIATPWPCIGPVFPSNPLLADQGKEDAMPKSKWKVPSGWDEYSPIGEQVRGTPFICFKTPLFWKVCHFEYYYYDLWQDDFGKCLEMTYFWM